MDKADLKSALSPITETVIRIDERTKSTDKKVDELKSEVICVKQRQGEHETRLTVVEGRSKNNADRPKEARAWLGWVLSVLIAILGILAYIEK